MLVCYEMEWTVRYFLYNKEVWEERRNPECPGSASYAARKAAMWFALAADADQTFAHVNRLYSRQFN
jgi:hypothetical protein